MAVARIASELLNRLKTHLLLLRYRGILLKDASARRFLQELRIFNRKETVRYLVEHHSSCARFGDGEFAVMGGGSNFFQEKNETLAAMLRKVLNEPVPGLLVCLPISLKSTRGLVLNSRLFWLGFCASYLHEWVMPFVNSSFTYGDNLFTRFYITRTDKSRTAAYIMRLKQIWEGESLLIVEGEFSRLGVGNDLFRNAAAIRRILVPSENAFSRYEAILASVRSHRKPGETVILACGMTATVLAWQLAKDGIRALDLGHIDVEYEWFRMGATHKVPIPGKRINEADGGAMKDACADLNYRQSIVDTIL